MLLDITSGASSVLTPSGPDHRCQLHEFGAGVIVSATDQSGGGSAQVITRDGTVTRADRLGSVAVDPRSTSAVLAGPAGVVLVAGGRLVPVSSRPGGVPVFADAYGNFLVRWSVEEWGVLTQVGGVPVLRTVTVPPIITDVTPVLNIDQMTESGTILGEAALAGESHVRCGG